MAAVILDAIVLAGLLAAGQEDLRTIKAAGSVITVQREEDNGEIRDVVTVTSEAGTLESKSWCPVEFGSYDELSSFFTRFVRAVDSNDRKTVASLARFPLQVFGGDGPVTIRNAGELQRRYDDVFTARVLSRVAAAHPAKIFCRNDSAMIGSGVVWASLERKRLRFDVINR